MKSIAFLMPWYGSWPPWMELYLESCRFNPTVRWLLFSDLPAPGLLPANVSLVPMTKGDFSRLVQRKLGLLHFRLREPYKLCDLRPAFGRIFEDYLQGEDFFGFGDLDVVYGNLRKFLTRKVLSHHVISCHRDRVSGHFCLLANTAANRDLYLKIKDWPEKFCHRPHLELDDWPEEQQPRSLFFESYNTPQVPGRPWKDGREVYPTEWYWREGTLTNNLDEGDFLYFHFMVWKGGFNGARFGGGQFEKLPQLVHHTGAGTGWKINDTGFWGPRRSAPAVPAFASAPPASASRASGPIVTHYNEAHNGLHLTVTADHPDWNYAVGEPVRFTVEVRQDDRPLRGAPLAYVVGPEMMPAEPQAGVTARDGRLVLDAGTMAQPGFLRCFALVEHEGVLHRAVATAAFSPELIRPTQTEPPDFDAFWQKVREGLTLLPLDARLTPMPRRSTPKVEVFHLDLQNIGAHPGDGPSRIYGLLGVPRGSGKFPAILTPPGHNYDRIVADLGWAERGFITLRLGMHGVPLNRPPRFYQSLRATLGGYETLGHDHRDTHYFRRVLMGCLRANDFLAAHPGWDQRNLLILGGCHGGYLAMATAALDARVTACRAAYPSFCDLTGFVHGRAGGAPKLLADHPTSPFRPAAQATSAYYDTVNFARRIKVPGHYGWGYNDRTCAPTAMFAAYNVIPAPKTLAIVKEMLHVEAPRLTLLAARWLLQQVSAPAVRVKSKRRRPASTLPHEPS